MKKRPRKPAPGIKPNRKAALKIRALRESMREAQRALGGMRYRHGLEESALLATLTKANQQYEATVMEAGRACGIDFAEADWTFDADRLVFRRA